MYCLFGNFVGNTSKLDVTEMVKTAVSFHCDTHNALSTHSCRVPAVTNVTTVIPKVRKDAEQNLVGCFAEVKINSGTLLCFKRRNILPLS